MVFKTLPERHDCSLTHALRVLLKKIITDYRVKSLNEAIQTQPPDLRLYPAPKPRSCYRNPNSLRSGGSQATYAPQMTAALRAGLLPRAALNTFKARGYSRVAVP